MNTLLVEYLDGFLKRGDEIAFAHRRGLRVFRWSYRELATVAVEFARRLATLQIGKGDRVILCCENCPEWVAAFFGCLLRGAIVVPLDAQSDPGFVERVQDQVEAKLAVLDVATEKHLNLDLPVLLAEEIVRDPLSGSVKSVDILSEVSEDDTVEIVFTSGTTAEPKGVRITNRNLMTNLAPLHQEIQRYLKWERFVHPVRFLNLLPLSHVFGQFMGVFVPQLLGGEVVFERSLNPSRIVETIKRKRISVVVCVPRILETLREHVERTFGSTRPRNALHDLIRSAKEWSAFKRWWVFRRIHRLFGLKFWAFISGGATLSTEMEEFWLRLGFVVIQGYGMTETASLVSVNHPFKAGHGSIGKVMPGQEVKLAASGEILVRGKNISPGYWKGTGRSEGDENGWFHTGDVAEFDEEGNLYFKGRKKELIVTAAGLNVYPGDIEAVLNRQPEIKASVVIPFAGQRGPEPFAVLILREPDSDARKIIDRVNESLAEHQRLRRWYVWPEEDFPRTAMGKIRKHMVADKVEYSSLGRAPQDQKFGELYELITHAGGEVPPNVEPSATLTTDLKLDSLGRVELLSEIEDHYRIEINESEFNAATTIGEVEGVIHKGQAERTDEYPYPHWPHRWPISWVRIFLLYLIIVPLNRIMGRPTIKGVDNLRSVSGPLLLIANHLTMIDHVLIICALPGSFRRRVSIAMDGELLRDWIKVPEGIGWPTRLRYRIQYLLVAFFFNVFSMPQHSGFRRSFAFAGEMVDRGYNILVFPEGRRSSDGKLQPFKPGIGLLTKGLMLPVVPIRIDGLHEVAKQGRHFAPRGAIMVTIGKPVIYSIRTEAEFIAKDLEQRVICLATGGPTVSERSLS